MPRAAGGSKLFKVRKKSMAAQRYGGMAQIASLKMNPDSVADKRNLTSMPERTFRHRSISRRNKSLEICRNKKIDGMRLKPTKKPVLRPRASVSAIDRSSVSLQPTREW